MLIMYEKTMSGQWYEKIKDKTIMIKSQSKLDSIPEHIIDKAIQNPSIWIEVTDFKLKSVKNKHFWR